MKKRNNRLTIAILSAVVYLIIAFVIRPRWELYGDSLFLTSLMSALPGFLGVLVVTQLVGFASKKDVPMKFILGGGIWVLLMGFLNLGSNSEASGIFAVNPLYIVGAVVGLVVVYILEKSYFRRDAVE